MAPYEVPTTGVARTADGVLSRVRAGVMMDRQAVGRRPCSQGPAEDAWGPAECYQ